MKTELWEDEVIVTGPIDKVKARMAWGVIPPDDKRAMAQIQREGLMTEARDEIVAEAEATIRRMAKSSEMDLCFALEQAAESWLKRRGLLA